MKKYFPCLAFLLLPALVHADPASWSETEKRELFVGCQESILQDAEAHYLRQNHLRREELPLHFREHAMEALTPLFAICGCIVENISRQWSHEYFASHQDEYSAMVQKLMESGTCKVPEK